MTPDVGPPLSAIHFATRRQCAFAGYLLDGGLGKSGLAIGCLIFLRVGLSEDLVLYGKNEVELNLGQERPI